MFFTRKAWDRFSSTRRATRSSSEGEGGGGEEGRGEGQGQGEGQGEEKAVDKAEGAEEKAVKKVPTRWRSSSTRSRTASSAVSMHSPTLAARRPDPGRRDAGLPGALREGLRPLEVHTAKQGDRARRQARGRALGRPPARPPRARRRSCSADDHRGQGRRRVAARRKPVKVGARARAQGRRGARDLFEHAWRQTWKKFYVDTMHGVDWPAMKAAYARFLPYIDNNRDFAELISEMQGELNASHTGGRYRPTRPDADVTAALGFFPDPAWSGAGVKIVEVLEGRPAAAGGNPGEERRGDRGDRRREDRARRQLVPAAQPQGGQPRAPRPLRPAVRESRGRALGGDGQADHAAGAGAAALRALGARAPRRRRAAVGRPHRLRPHPGHERRRLPGDLRGDLRPRRRQGGDRARHPLQRRRQPRRAPDRLPVGPGLLPRRSPAAGRSASSPASAGRSPRSW